MALQRQLGFITGALVVVASMVGSGVFYLPQIILGLTQNGWVFMLTFLVGGLIAITGSLSYAEMATMFPDDGGEYQYLKKTFGFLPAFLTGWISLLVGFTASITGSALVLKMYFVPLMDQMLGAENIFHNALFMKFFLACIIITLGTLHIIGVKFGSSVQNALTVIKMTIVISFILAGLYVLKGADFSQALSWVGPKAETSGLLIYSAALINVMYIYSGWNGATYIGGEMKDPQKNLPRALLSAAVLTTVLYLLLNLVFIAAVTPEKMAGNPGFGGMTAARLFSPGVSTLYGAFIVVILLSSISVQLMIGPRVYFKMAEDGVLFRFLSTVPGKSSSPVYAIITQIALSIFYVLVFDDDELFSYMGFALSVFPILTVIGVMYLRRTQPNAVRPFKVPGYPVVPAIFILLSSAMLALSLANAFTSEKKFGYIMALVVVLGGIPIYYVWKKLAASQKA
ncbi:MAG TPA: amino acid permease [Leptospiraceae bacterium]|nr:amino acid permease [Leptospirales bacterium]HMX56014.1 amino acid permease [Leptospiraceae bacterium]HMY45358.1 amino acid permease [Leptospiraceae bacterium]HNE23571.1 amino acid permease [Leptospiraceae bacterium]HNJ34310.1 amino acid permease [Leptospiraceae bacterium]